MLLHQLRIVNTRLLIVIIDENRILFKRDIVNEWKASVIPIHIISRGNKHSISYLCHCLSGEILIRKSVIDYSIDESFIVEEILMII